MELRESDLKGTVEMRCSNTLIRIPKLPAMLGDIGYVSFQSGKWWEGSPAREASSPE
ncbi:MAG: hypothetical protein R3C11_19025 [Planctomycetaceae bacterium]